MHACMYVSVLDPNNIAYGMKALGSLQKEGSCSKCKVAESGNSAAGKPDQEALREQEAEEGQTTAALTSGKLHGIGTGHFWNSEPTRTATDTPAETARHPRTAGALAYFSRQQHGPAAYCRTSWHKARAPPDARQSVQNDSAAV